MIRHQHMTCPASSMNVEKHNELCQFGHPLSASSMFRSLFLYVSCTLAHVLVSQSIAPRGVVATGGTSPNGELSWSVGQVTGYTFPGASNIITAGIQQPDLLNISLQLKVFLGGPYQSIPGLMMDALRSASLLPLQEPYTALGFQHFGGGGEQMAAPVLATSGNDAIVDWLFIELRAADQQTVMATRAALIQRDGDVVETDGVSPVRISAGPGSYHLAIRHRNHLAIMTAFPILFAAQPSPIDLTDGSTPLYGTAAQMISSGVNMLWPGDANGDGSIRYSGSNNDRTVVLNAVGATTFLSPVTAYHRADVNLNGQTGYSGSNNDRTVILNSVGATSFLTARTAQLP